METNISLPDDSQFWNNKSGIVHTCRHIHLYNNVGEAQHTQVMPTSLIKWKKKKKQLQTVKCQKPSSFSTGKNYKFES